MGTYIRNANSPRRYTYYTDDYLMNAGSYISPAVSLPFVCSYQNLPQSLTINSQTKTPDFLLYGNSVNATDWTAEIGTNFSKGGAGAADIDFHGPFTNSADLSVGLGTGYYECDDGTTGNFDQKDFVLEAVFMNTTGSGANFPINNRQSSGGWRFGAYAGTGLYVQVNDDAANSVLARSATSDVNLGQWVHMIVFADYDGILRVYSNGIKGTVTGNMSTITGNVSDNASKIRIGAGASTYNGIYAYLAGWSGASWLDADNWDDVAYDRFRRLCGYYHADIGTYTITDGSVHSTTDIYNGSVRKLSFMANNWVPLRRTETGLAVTHAQPALDNQLEGDPEALGTGWTATGCTINADDTASAALFWLADGIATDSGAQASSTIHDTAVTNDSNCVASFWAKKGSTDWCMADVVWSATSHICYFDLDNGVTGTTDAALTTRMESWGDGWYRCFIHYDGSATTTFYVGPCDADNSKQSTGDGSTSNIYLHGLNVINGTTDFNPAYVRAANTSRTADTLSLQFSSDLITESVGALTLKTSSHSTDTALGAIDMVKVNDGGSAAEQVAVTLQSGDKAQVDTATSGGSAGQASSPVDVMDGSDHDVKVRFITDNTQVITDGRAGAVDTDADPPDDLDTVVLGTRVSALKIYNDDMG